MTTQETEKRTAILFCTCSGACPSMTKIDFWALAEQVRLEYEGKIEFMALHPRLCEPDGERFMSNVLKEGMVYITPACKENKQQKLLRDGFDKAGVPMDADHWLPISMALEDTAAVFQKIKAAVEGVIGKRQTGKE
jgi:hypothetical protein